jgi:hypothetical protein
MIGYKFTAGSVIQIPIVWEIRLVKVGKNRVRRPLLGRWFRHFGSKQKPNYPWKRCIPVHYMTEHIENYKFTTGSVIRISKPEILWRFKVGQV